MCVRANCEYVAGRIFVMTKLTISAVHIIKTLM